MTVSGVEDRESRAALRPTRLLIVGMMGAGKTTVASLVAERLGWSVFDSDVQVEARSGRSVAELFTAAGETGFRTLESEVLREALSPLAPPAVVAIAGGAVLDARNRRLIRDGGTVVWLRARPQTLAVRVGDGSGRPLLGVDPERSLVDLEAVRRPLYEEGADAVIDVDDLLPSEVADRVVRIVEESPSGESPRGERLS